MKMASGLNYKKYKKNGYRCGCCFNGERNVKAKHYKSSVRQYLKKDLIDQVEDALYDDFGDEVPYHRAGIVTGKQHPHL